MDAMKINKTNIEQLPKLLAKDGKPTQKRYYDDELKGFGIRLTSGGSKSFFVEKGVNGHLKRSTLGHYPAITAQKAREMALEEIGKMMRGIDPIAEKKANRRKSVTLQEAFEDYLKARKNLKDTTKLDYERVLKQVVPKWMNKQLVSITKEMIIRRHIEYGKSNSQARANLAMRLLRAIFNYAIYEYQDHSTVAPISVNPVKFLSHARSWYRVERRQSIIRIDELLDWYEGLTKLPENYPDKQGALWQDYFLLVLLTGMRRSEAASLKWIDIDFKSKLFTLRDTKNRTNHMLPMSDYILEIFQRRRKASTSQYVFPVRQPNEKTKKIKARIAKKLGKSVVFNKKDSHVTDPRKAMLKVIELSGITFDVHSLRRTFITMAESLDISAYSLKRLLNHKMSNDVTAGYLVMDVERLRKPMQQITDYLLKCMGVQKSAQVVELGSLKEGSVYA